jgi:nucleotide-binding universal stress UspA family protein
VKHIGVRPRIIVGVNQSSAAMAALSWAVKEAVRRDAVVVPVHAWQWSGAYRASYAPIGTWTEPDDELEEAWSGVAGAIARVAPELTPLVCHGPTAQVLLSQAEGADLLVLGGRRVEPGAPASLGPIVAACVPAARCPVVVVPADPVTSVRCGAPAPQYAEQLP